MVHATTPGESAGPTAPRFLARRTLLRRGAGLCVLLAGLFWLIAGPAAAGTLYRCVGSTGETVFSGSTSGYTSCKRIGSTPPARATSPGRSATEAGTRVRSADEAGTVMSRAHAGGGVAAPKPPVFEPVVEAKPSFAGVTGGVMTTASVPPVAPVPVAGLAAPAPRRGWEYRESTSTDLTALPAPEPAKGSRVLRGAVYRITRADGGVEYTNIPQAGGAKGQSIKMLFTYIATCAACDVHSRIDWNNVTLNLVAYGDVIRSASGEFGVDEALLRAVIHAESAFNPRALSVAGAQGLMQLIPGTARDMGVLDAFDATQNIRGGARYLALLLKNFKGDERLAAAAYNAGPGAVQKYNGVPPYDETQVYVQRVGVLRKRYGESLKGQSPPHAPLATM